MNQAGFTIFPQVMKGATSLLPSIEGLVPLVAAGDQAKFLTGAGTWAAVAAVSDPTGHSGALLTNNGTTTSWTTITVSGNSFASVNSLASVAASNLTLGTGSFGTFLTVASSTGATTFSGALNAFNVAAGITPATELEVDSTSTSSPRGIMSAQYTTSTDGARFHGRKARGTRASPTTVVTGDNLSRWVGSGYDGSNYLENTSIIFGTEGTIAATRVPTNIQFWTATNATPSVLTQALILKSDQSATFAGSILGSGGTAPTSATTGSNIFTAGIATSGPGYFGGDVTRSSSANSADGFIVTNSNTSTAATSQISFRNSNGTAGQTAIAQASTGWTAYGALIANSGWLYNNSGRLTIMSDNASGTIHFASGGNVSRANFDASGNFNLIGTVTSTALASFVASVATTGALPQFETVNSAASGFSTMRFRNSGASGLSLDWGLGGNGSAQPNLFYLYDNTNSALRLSIGATTATFTGNLTVSGTGTSSFAGILQVSPASGGGQAKIIAASTATNGSSINLDASAASGGRNMAIGTGLSGDASGAGAFFIYDNSGGGLLLKMAGATGVTTFSSTVSGTSTISAAVLAKSLGLTENLYAGGTINVVGGALPAFQSTTTGTTGFGAYVFLDATSRTGGKQWSMFSSGTTEVSGAGFWGLGLASVGDAIRVSSSDRGVNLLSPTEATTGGAGSLTTAGGIYATKKIISTTDFESGTIGNGFILKSPDSTRWRITISNAGVLTTTSL